jgi:hypothetical protein
MTRGWEHGAGESPFLGQAGGGCGAGAGGAFLAGRAAGTNVFPTWPRVPPSARSHWQDAPAATPAPAASFPQSREGGGSAERQANWVSWGGWGLRLGNSQGSESAPRLRSGRGKEARTPWVCGHISASLARLPPP